MLLEILQEYGFSKKESKIYLVCLELENSPASKIARHLGENRITVYSTLKEMCKKGYIKEYIKNKVRVYTAVPADKLLQDKEFKLEKFKKALPEFLAINNNKGSKAKVYFYEGLEQLKNLFKEIALESENMGKEPYRTFVGTTDIDPEFQKYLKEEFVPFRMKFKTETEAIVPKSHSQYTDYHKDTHNTLIIEEDIFEMGNEIVIYGKNKIAILMYKPGELSGLVIESMTLHKGLTSIFRLIWKAFKK